MEIAQTANEDFEAAADSVVRGDLPGLRLILARRPALVQARSSLRHRATLLHYVAANGVEQHRQRTPANIVAIAEALLRAGADVDASAHLYGADCTTLELAATSVHPERAGVAEPLLALLLASGARLREPLIRSCLANGRKRAAEFLADRLAERGEQISLVAAAGLGNLHRVLQLWHRSSPATQRSEVHQALLFACQFGRLAVVEYLLEEGVEIGCADAQGQTALHHAVIGAQASIVSALLRHGAPLHAVNSYGGSPLEQALWSAAHGGEPAVYLQILQSLVASGATLPQFHAPVHAQIDPWLEQRGCLSKPEWSWTGGEVTDRPPAGP